MAASLITERKCCRGCAAQLSVLSLLFSALCHSHAEALPDPTRPPAEISTPAQIAASKEPGLQSVYISPIRRAAIINGQTVELGGRFGNSRLVEVSESGIVLEGAQGRRTMALFPGVEFVSKIAPKTGKPAAAEEKR